jgi:hypothetical protein
MTEQQAPAPTIRDLMQALMPTQCMLEDHGNHPDHAEGGEHYVQCATPCGCISLMMVWCGQYIEVTKEHDEDTHWKCPVCGQAVARYGDTYSVLAPVVA